MKKLICLTLLLAFAAPAFSQQAPKQSALEKMVATERAFAKLSEEQGTHEAFMAYIADDGILFRPTAVRGKQWMTEHPAPPSDKRPLLSWYPTVAGIALAGDMGYTTGPWEYKSDIHDAKPVAWGHFLTVWKKQADGSWKFAIDLGISHPQPAQAAAPWELPKNYKAPGRMKGIWSFSNDALLARDREFAKDSAARGARAAFVSFAAADVRLYREEKFPLIGQVLAPAVLPASPTVWSWEPAFADVSVSDDLGYTYGTYKIEETGPTPKLIETGNYFRIWKKAGGAWKVIFDLNNPIPPEKKD
jgi:ketosteroid isomerase-like protein